MCSARPELLKNCPPGATIGTGRGPHARGLFHFWRIGPLDPSFRMAFSCPIFSSQNWLLWWPVWPWLLWWPIWPWLLRFSPESVQVEHLKIIQHNWSRRLSLKHQNAASKGATLTKNMGNGYIKSWIYYNKIHFNIYFYLYLY